MPVGEIQTADDPLARCGARTANVGRCLSHFRCWEQTSVLFASGADRTLSDQNLEVFIMRRSALAALGALSFLGLVGVSCGGGSSTPANDNPTTSGSSGSAGASSSGSSGSLGT